MLVKVAGPGTNGSDDTDDGSDATMFVPSCLDFRTTSKSHTMVKIDDYGRPDTSKKSKRFSYFVFAISALGIGTISIAIVGFFSHFQKGHSKFGQQLWTMTWLVYGIVFGPVYVEWGHRLTYWLVDAQGRFTFRSQPIKISVLILITVTLKLGGFGYPAIFGFVIVGRMLREYGTCIRIS
jgi:hypothetical protein